MAKKHSSGAADRYKKLLAKVQSMDLGGGPFWKPPEGRSVIRILPPKGSMEFFFKEVGRHYISAANNYYCPSICTDGQDKCPLCELNQELYDAGEKDEASKWRASRSFYMNIIVRDEEAAGPRIFSPGITIFGSIVALAQDPDYGEIYDAYEGTDLSLDRKGTGLDTEYNLTPKRDISDLGTEDEIEAWMDAAVDIDQYVTNQLLDYDKLVEESGASVYLFEDEEEPEPEYEEDDESEDESPSAVVQRRLAKRRGRRPERSRR